MEVRKYTLCFAMAGKKYPDLCYLFMRGLIAHERWQRTRHYLKSAAECTSKAIVSLELSPTSIKSVKQTEKLESIGGETSKRLKALHEDSSYSSLKPLGGKFVSSAGAILVAMLEVIEEAIQQGHSQDHAVLVSKSQLKHRAEKLSEEASFIMKMNCWKKILSKVDALQELRGQRGQHNGSRERQKGIWEVISRHWRKVFAWHGGEWRF